MMDNLVRSTFTILLMLVIGSAGDSAARAAAHVEIMPSGDSITVGFNDPPFGSYRYHIEKYFQNNSIAFDFVGSQTTPAGSVDDALSDQDHEGYDAYTIQELTTEMTLPGPTTSNGFSPDTVLLLAGTNNANSGETVELGNFTTLYGSLFDAFGSSEIVVATVPMVGPSAWNWCTTSHNSCPDPDIGVINGTTIPTLNAALTAAAASRSNVTVVDYYAIMDPDTHLLSGGVHPNNAGQQLLANLFLQGMGYPVSVPEPSQLLMMLMPVTGLLVWKGKRFLARSRRAEKNGSCRP